MVWRSGGSRRIVTGAVGHGVEVAVEQQGGAAARPAARAAHARHHALHVAVHVVHACAHSALANPTSWRPPALPPSRSLPTVHEAEREAPAGSMHVQLHVVVHGRLSRDALDGWHQHAHRHHLVLVTTRHLTHKANVTSPAHHSCLWLV